MLNAILCNYWVSPKLNIFSQNLIFKWMELLAGTVLANNLLLAGTVLANNLLLAGTVPANKFLLEPLKS